MQEAVHPFAQGSGQVCARALHQPRSGHEVSEPATRRLFPRHPVEPEFVGPRQERAPQDLVQHDDRGDEGRDSINHGAHVALVRSFLKVRPQAPQAEIALADSEDLGGHQEEPPSGPAHHAVPDEPQGREWQLQSLETEPPIEPEHRGRLMQLARQRRDRLVEGVGHVPGLRREDQQDGGQFGGRLLRQDRAETQKDHRQEGQDRDALQDVQEGDQDAAGGAAARGRIAIDQSEGEGQDVRRSHPRRRQQGIKGQGRR